MRGWNVVATAAEGKFTQALSNLARYGTVSPTAYANVIMMRAHDLPGLVKMLAWEWEEYRGRLLLLNRVVPVTHTFSFQDPQIFQKQAAETVLAWASELAGKTFHVRMHRRGFMDRLVSVEEETTLNNVVIQATEQIGRAGQVTIEHPDAVVAVETIGTEGGLSLWFREDLARYPFLRIDA